METTTKIDLKELYEQDFVLWTDKTVQQLQNRDVVSLDWEHLTEEIAALGNEQRRKVDSYLKQILIHLLLYRYWTSEKERCAQGWQDELEAFRDQLEDLLESRTLYNHAIKVLDKAYQKARSRVIKKTQLSPDIFPEKCPFTLQEILDFDFLPE